MSCSLQWAEPKANADKQELGDLIVGKEDETRGGCINNGASWSGGRQQWELNEEEEKQRKMGRKPWRGWMH